MRVSQVSWTPIISTVSPLQASRIRMAADFSSVTQDQLSEVPEEAKYYFSRHIGQRLAGELKRFELLKPGSKNTKRSPEQLKAWAVHLFGDESNPDDPEHSEGQDSNLEFFSDHLSQGSINDCFLIAALYAVLKNPHIGKIGLANMIDCFHLPQPLVVAPGVVGFEYPMVFKITFPGFVDTPVIVQPSDIQVAEQVKGGLGFRILEQAFAQLSQRLSLSHVRVCSHLNDVLSSLHGGGYCSTALYALTGNPITEFGAEPNTNQENVFVAYLSATLARLHQRPNDYILLAGTAGPEKGYRDEERRFLNWHAYAIKPCLKTGKIIVIDPWDTQRNRHLVELDDLIRFFNSFTLVEVNVSTN